MYKSDNSFVFIEELNDKSKKVDLLEYKQIYYKKFGEGLIKQVNGNSMKVLFRTIRKKRKTITSEKLISELI